MTLLDDRPGRVPGHPGSSVAGATELVERMVAELTPESAKPVAKVLFGDVVRIYRGVLEEGGEVVATQRARVRAAAPPFLAAGGSPDTVVDMLGRLASHLIGVVAVRQPRQVVRLVDTAHLLVRDFLAGAAAPPKPPELTREKRWSVVQRLVLDGEVPAAITSTLDTDYVVAVLRFQPPVPTERLMALIEEHSVERMLSAPAEDGAIVLVPARAADLLSRLQAQCQVVLDLAPWLVTSSRPRGEIAAGYREAKDVLALAVWQPPGRYQLEDFLVEYAIVKDPLVSRRLVTVIEPLFENEVLRETLETLIRTDFNRTVAARELFVHRSTLDYRIRRIEEVTGHAPLSSRGAYVLRVAMIAHAMAG